MGLRSHSVPWGYLVLVVFILNGYSMTLRASCARTGFSSRPDLTTSPVQSYPTTNTSVIQTPATGAITATYILAEPGSSSAVNQVSAAAANWNYSKINLAGTVTKPTMVISPTTLSAIDNRVFTGSGGVSKWMCLSEATGFEPTDIPSTTSLDIDEDNATRYVRISIHSNDENSDFHEHSTPLTVGLPKRCACDRIGGGFVVARAVSSPFFYNASCMGQYYITVNFS
ncbi:MAG TPA: hypothetical protein VFO76_08830 [Candidatus Kapabacteria bacterium]|nr:hypothetical protein [Candidatus Kapabacteria bacterium]